MILEFIGSNSLNIFSPQAINPVTTVPGSDLIIMAIVSYLKIPKRTDFSKTLSTKFLFVLFV
jgi:hypothetical protein